MITGLRETYETGERWKLPEMMAMAAKAIAIVYDEYLDQPEVALHELEKGTKEIGLDASLIRLQRGNVFYRAGRYQEAYDLWLGELDIIEKDDAESAIDALCFFSKCGDVAGRLKLCSSSAKIFLTGRLIAQNVGFQMKATAFGVDGAHALWLDGRRDESLHLLATCLDELEQQAGKQEPAGFHTLWKVTEQIVRWCSLDAGAPGTAIVIDHVGLCSEYKDEERHKFVQGLTRAPAIAIWIFLSETEIYCDLGREIYLKLISREDGAQFLGPRAMRAMLVQRRAFHDRDFERLPEILEEFGEAEAMVKSSPNNFFGSIERSVNSASDIPEIEKYAVESFPIAVLFMLADGIEWQQIIPKWRESAKRTTSGYDFEPIFRRINEVLRTPQDEAARVYKASETRTDRLLASIRLATLPDSSLSACFVGCVSLVTDQTVKSGYLGENKLMGQFVRQIWSRRFKFKAEFMSPRLSVPAIEAACVLPYQGARLAAHILLAAQTAVNTHIPESLLITLRSLANGYISSNLAPDPNF